MAFGIDDAISAVSGLIDKALSFIPNPEEKAKAQMALEQQAAQFAQALSLAQMEVNKTEAASEVTFVAGWRPFIGWVCGGALAFQYLVRPMAPWLAQLCGADVPPLPGLDNNLWELMAGMLGLGGLRSWEKVQTGNGTSSGTSNGTGSNTSGAGLGRKR